LQTLGSRGIVGECALTGKTIDVEDTRDHPNFVDTLHGLDLQWPEVSEKAHAANVEARKQLEAETTDLIAT